MRVWPVKGMLCRLVCIGGLLGATYGHATVEPSLLGGVQDAPSSTSVTLNVPTFGSSRSNGMLQRAEYQQGAAILRQLRKQAPMLEDPWTQQYFMTLFRQINAQAGLPPPVALVLIQDPQINAFAVSGGLVALYSGLVLQADTPDQVAGVLAHEVAHVSQRHFSRRQDDLKNNKWLSVGGLVAGLLLAKQDADAGAALVTGSQAAAIERQLSYSRDQEREADRIGMQLMVGAGYSPQGMADFFDIMQRHSGQRGFLPAFALSHPLNAERLSEARLRAAQWPTSSRTRVDLTPFRLVKGRLAVLTGQSHIADLLALADQDDVAAATLVSAYRVHQRFDDARRVLSRLQTKHPDWPLLSILAIEIELSAQRPQAALALVTPLYQLNPDDRPLALLHAQALIDSQQAQAAMDVLLPMSVQQPSDSQVWQLLSMAAGRLPSTTPDKAVTVLRYRAEDQFWRGEVDAAIVSLERARALAVGTTALWAKIDQRVQQMRVDRDIKA